MAGGQRGVRIREISLDITLGKISARVWGPEDGKPVLALHGWLDNAATFDRLAPLLGDLKIVAPDMPGHGWSDHIPTGMNYNFIESVPIAAEILNALGWEKYSLIGHSMGGGIAPLIAAIFPNNVERLVMIDSLGPLSETPEGNIFRLQSFVHEWIAPMKNSPRVFGSKEKMIQIRKSVGDISEEGAACLISRGIRELDGGYTWSSDPRLRLPSSIRMTEEQVCAFLKEVACPSLVIWAKDGLAYKLPGAAPYLENRLAQLPKGRQIVIEGGHHVHLDEPDRVATPIRAFFEAKSHSDSTSTTDSRSA